MRLVRNVRDFSEGITERKLMVFASSGCYYLFMALVPVLLLVCSLLPYTSISREVLMSELDDYLTPALTDILQGIIDDIYGSSQKMMPLSIVVTAVSASASMRALMKGMDAAYGVVRRENTVVFFIKALLYMILLLVTMFVTLALGVYGPHLLAMIRIRLPQLAPQVEVLEPLMRYGRYWGMFGVLTVFFSILYVLMPAGRHALVKQIPGAVLAAGMWIVFSAAFAKYITLSNKFGAYGAIGTTMVAMLWMCYCFFFLLLGGYFNSCCVERRDRR